MDAICAIAYCIKNDDALAKWEKKIHFEFFFNFFFVVIQTIDIQEAFYINEMVLRNQLEELQVPKEMFLFMNVC